MQVKKQELSALLRKSLAYQKKNVAQNCCVLLAPIVLIGLLGIMQALLDNLTQDEATVRPAGRSRVLVTTKGFDQEHTTAPRRPLARATPPPARRVR